MSTATAGIPPGTVLVGKYQIDLMIGRGGMGCIYRARHVQLDEPIAIKVLRSDVVTDPEAVMRFQREAMSAAKLKSEHVARVFDVGVLGDGAPYIVMEYLAGADLGTLVDNNGPMAVDVAVDLILQACDALAEAHSIGIVHRDVKPTNLFLTRRHDGVSLIKILDFGVSKSPTGNDLSLTQTASMLGTPAYMSPEQMRSARRVDARTDIWSLGTVLYELVEGRRPFLAETFSEMCVMAAVDPHERMILAPQLEPIIARCLAKTPEGRYPSIAELAAELAPWASDANVAAHYVSRTQRLLGRAAQESRPIALPAGYPSAPVALPRNPGASGPVAALPTMVPAAEPTDVIRTPRVSRRWVIAAFAIVLAGGIAAFVAVRATSGPSKTVETASPTEGSTLRMTPESGSGPGSAPSPNIVDGSATGSDSVATGSGELAAGSDNKAGSGDPKKGGGKKGGGGGKKGGGTATVGRGSGSGSAEIKKGSAAGSAKKPCNPFESREGC